MNPEDCIKAVAQLASAQKGQRLGMIAGHWGTFKLTDEPMDEPPAWMRELWQTAHHDANDLWILRHGETRSIR
jgi:N-acyl-phosphatidylethanolamine-hydrolysing phospholipase D